MLIRIETLFLCFLQSIPEGGNSFSPERGKALVETLGSRHFQAVVDLNSTELLSEIGV